MKTAAIATKERPILFSAEMVRAILAGRKTQTRRSVKTRAAMIHTEKAGIPPRVETWWCAWESVRGPKLYLSCPYGKVGDTLWVREACRAFERKEDCVDGVVYLADGAFREIENTREAADAWVALNCYHGKRGATVPPIHMPRWASRLTLEITDIRVQRVHEITDADVIAEGVENIHIEKNRKFFHRDDVHALAFGELWNRINGKKHPWSSNPWVWCVSFKVDCAGDAARGAK